MLAEFVSSMTFIISSGLFPGSPIWRSEELATTQNPSIETALTTCSVPARAAGTETYPVVRLIDAR